MTETPIGYPPPVDLLLTYGDAGGTKPEGWPNYLELGLGPEHVPDLIRLVRDDEMRWGDDAEEPGLWAQIHAWRALGQLRAAEAAPALVGLLHHIDHEGDDWAGEELPEVFGQLGPPALPALEAYLADRAHGTFARVAVCEGLWRIGQAGPGAREACVTALTRLLETPGEDDESLNGFAIYGLLKLRAVEAAPAIERAFAEARVDEMVVGDWEDVQVELGLKAAREKPRRPYPYGFRPPSELPEVPERIRAWNEALRAKKAAIEQAKAKRREKKKRKRGRGKGKARGEMGGGR